MGEILLSLLWVLLCCAVVLGLAYWFTRHVVGKGGLGTLGVFRSDEQLQILRQLSLGKEQRVVVLRVGERVLLLGVTQSEISVLAECTPQEAETWFAEGETQAQQPLGFAETFKKALKQRVGGEQRWKD